MDYVIYQGVNKIELFGQCDVPARVISNIPGYRGQLPQSQYNIIWIGKGIDLQWFANTLKCYLDGELEMYNERTKMFEQEDTRGEVFP